MLRLELRQVALSTFEVAALLRDDRLLLIDLLLQVIDAVHSVSDHLDAGGGFSDSHTAVCSGPLSVCKQ